MPPSLAHLASASCCVIYEDRGTRSQWLRSQTEIDTGTGTLEGPESWKQEVLHSNLPRPESRDYERRGCTDGTVMRNYLPAREEDK